MEFIDIQPYPKPQMVKKFYFLDYFFILLESISVQIDQNSVFRQFRILKDNLRLGESKYKKLTSNIEDLSPQQLSRYKYTFKQVITEAKSYELIIEKDKNIYLSKIGLNLLKIGKTDKTEFNSRMLNLMESKYSAFYHLVKLCYKVNKTNNGLLFFPIYSPRKLDIDKKEIRKVGDFVKYTQRLSTKIEADLALFNGINVDLSKSNSELIDKLFSDNLITSNLNDEFNSKKYNSILSRCRKHWLNFLLKNIYEYPFSFTTFNIWAERGKQLGIIHSTEFHPMFSGRVIYPTSIIAKNNNNSDLIQKFVYSNNEKLYIHLPRLNSVKNQNSFVDTLVNYYFDLRRLKGIHFIRIDDLRENVCFKMRIPSFVFNNFLNEIYFKSLKGQTKVKISLEADRLPTESNAMYLKREPILIGNQFKNIIAIDYKKEI